MWDEYAQVEVTGNDAERLRGEIWTRSSRLSGPVESIRDQELGFTLHGQRVWYWIFVINTLKRDGRYEEALLLAIECLDIVEASLCWGKGGKPLVWWYIQVVKIAMKMARYEVAIETIDRWIAAPGSAESTELDEVQKRLAQARKGKERMEALASRKRPAPMW